jgi:hypothetical protein
MVQIWLPDFRGIQILHTHENVKRELLDWSEVVAGRKERLQPSCGVLDIEGA